MASPLLARLTLSAATAVEGRLSPRRLERLRDAKLARLYRHAYETVPFYRNLYAAAGLGPDSVRTVSDLGKLPTVGKRDLQAANLSGLMSREVALESCVKVSTSGSTGLPLRLYFTRTDFSRLNWNWVRPALARGVRPWHSRLEITGPHNVASSRRWYERFGLWRIDSLSLFTDPREWIEAWRTLRPDVLWGYSGSLKLMARVVLEKGIDDIRPRRVFGVSDLVDAECRELVPKAFGRPLIDLYGAAEAGCISWECDRCGAYHVNADTVILEFLRDGKPVAPGVEGEIFVTNLHSRAMPIIRYDLGDVGAASPNRPACGRSLPLMAVIEGRSDASLVLPSGKRLSPLFFFGLMKPVPGLDAWRVVQDRPARLTYHVVPGPGFGPGSLDLIRSRTAEFIGEGLEVRVVVEAALPPDPSGKVRSVVSLVGAAGGAS
jgi:phenylacetate-CoA ligase